MPFVSLGRGVSIEVDAYRERKFAGTVTAVNPALDPASRSVVVEAAVENNDNALRSGMFATVRITREGGAVGVFAPKAAVYNDQATQSYRAFVIQEGIIKLRVVQLGTEESDWYQILSGLEADETVATSSLEQLYEGAKVRLRSKSDFGLWTADFGHSFMQWLAQICVHRPVFATVIVLFLTVVGGFSFFTLGVDRFPKIDLPTISVSTSNPGAAPEEMESEITDIIEGAVNTVPGIEEMRSNSSKGGSNVTLTFNLDKDPDQAFQELQQKISTVVNRLPETADPPVVRKSDPDSQPILMYSISGPRNVIELTDLAQNLIQKRIESADGVGEVIIFGARQREIKLYVNPDRLKAYNLSVTEVTAAVSVAKPGASRRDPDRGLTHGRPAHRQ